MVAVVTGGSRGIGLATVKQLLKDGFEVVAVSRNRSPQLETLAEEYRNKLDFFRADVSDTDDAVKLAAYLTEKHGKIDLLVNNAGVAPKERKDILEITPEDFDYVLNINLKGMFFITQKLVPLLAANGGGRIVNISSMSAYTASVNRGEYCISKAGVSMATKLFAARLAQDGISVIEIRPGIIETDMTAKVKEKYEKLISEGITPIRRMGQPEDIAKCVSAVAAGNLDFCTGTVIDCDGGFNVRCL